MDLTPNQTTEGRITRSHTSKEKRRVANHTYVELQNNYKRVQHQKEKEASMEWQMHGE